MCAGDNLVKSSVISGAAYFSGFLGPRCLVSVAKVYIRGSKQCLIWAVLIQVNFLGHIFESLLGHVSHFERILRRQDFLDISKQTFIIFGPELVTLLQKKS